MLHIKLKVMANEATCMLLFCPYTWPRPPRWSQKVKTFLLKVDFSYQSKGNGTQSTMQAHILHPRPPDGVKRSKHIFVLKVVMLRIKLKGMETEYHASTYSIPLTPQMGLKDQNKFLLK